MRVPCYAMCEIVCELGLYRALTTCCVDFRYISVFDFKIHNLSGDQALSDLDIRKIWYDTREELEGMDFSLCKEQGADMVSFNHLTAGLDSGYYAYLT